MWVQPVEYVYDDGTTETVTVSVPAPARAKRDEVEALVAEAIDAQAGRMKRAVVRKVENIKRGVEGEDAKTEEVMREKRRRHWERHVHGSGKHF